MTTSNNPVVLITGGGTGVGRACAIRFGAMGYDVVINYSRSEAESKEVASSLRSKSVNVLLAPCDVSRDVEVRQMIESIRSEFGRLDVLVNNAAITHFVPHQELESLTEEMWDRILAVNLKGTFFCTRAAAPLLADGPNSAVVNVSSVAGISGMGSSIAYCASKAGVNSLTKSLARVLAPKIRVNAVCPGPIDSRWHEGAPKPVNLTEMTSTYPIPRASQPDDIVDTIMYLATGTHMTTGQLLVVDGGRTM